jgi:Tfp pilus assembly protein PilO
MRPITTIKFSRLDALCAVGVVLIASLTFVSVCRAKSHQLVQLVRRTHELSAQVADIHKLRHTLEQAEERLDTLNAELAALHKRIPDDLDADGFLQDLTELAARNGVVIVRVRPGEFTERGLYREAPVAVDATARFANLYSFIGALRDMPRLATIDDIDVRSEDDGVCRASFSLRIYAYRETDDVEESRQKKGHSSA